MGLGDVWNAITGMFGSNAPQMASVQPINPDTSAGQPPSLGTPGGPVGGSGIGGTTPAVSISASGQPTPLTQLPQSISIPGMGNVAMPKQTAFDNPWVQAALSAYFAGAGSPRSRGFGGALSEAGKAGIGAYQQARAQQWAPYKTLAELQKAGAETQLAGAQARKADVEARGAESVGRVNQLTGAAMISHADELEAQGDKVGAQIWRQAGQGVSLNTKEVVPYKDAFALGNQLAEQKKTEAAAAELRARKDVDVARVGVLQEQPKLMRAEEGRAGAQADLANQSAKVLRGDKPMTDEEIEKAGDAAGAEKAKGVVKSPFETVAEYQKRHDAAVQQGHDTRVKLLRDQRTQLQQTRGQIVSGAVSGAAGAAPSAASTSVSDTSDTSDTGGGLSDDDIASRHY